MGWMKTPWLLLGLALGCTDKKSEDSGHAPESHYLWAGWNHTWSKLSHRVSFIRAIAAPDGGLELGIRGGDWSTGDAWADDAAYRMHLQRVSGEGLDIVHGETALTVGPDGAASATATAEVAGDTVAVVLRGFEIDTDVAQGPDYPDYDPFLGYTSRGFGMSVGAPTQEGDTVSFDVSAQIRWGPRDRDDMNAAMLEAETSVVVAWTAIGHQGSQESVALSDSIDLPHTPPNSIQTGLSLPTGLSGGPGVIGITAFDLGVQDQDGGDGGDYLRSFGVEAPVGDGGAAPDEIQTEVTTTSVIELGTMNFTPQIDLLWISPESPDLAVEPLILSGTHDVGVIEVAPGG